MAVEADELHAVLRTGRQPGDEPFDGASGDEGDAQELGEVDQHVDDALDGDRVVGVIDDVGDRSVEVEDQQ